MSSARESGAEYDEPATDWSEIINDTIPLQLVVVAGALQAITLPFMLLNGAYLFSLIGAFGATAALVTVVAHYKKK
jgi:hypothetical protein